MARRRSFCVLFVDVKGAYYAAYRQLLVSALPRSGTLLALIDQLPASDLVKLRLRQRLDEANLLQKLPLSPAWRAFCEETLQDTWFSTEGAPNLTLTQRGSRPGDPLADLLFAVLLSDLDQELHCSLQAAGFIDAQPRLDFQTSSLDGQEPLPSIIWADDMAIPQSFLLSQRVVFQTSRPVPHSFRSFCFVRHAAFFRIWEDGNHFAVCGIACYSLVSSPF